MEKEEQLGADELDASNDEEEMEVDNNTAPPDVTMETETNNVKEKTSEEAATTAPEPTAVSSWLPQSKEELESLVSAIHETVNNTVLPRLHKCLTAKVQHMQTLRVILCSQNVQLYNSRGLWLTLR